MLVFGKRIAFKLAVRQEVKYGEFEGHPSSTRSTEAHLKHDPQGEKRSLGSLREVDGPVRNRSRRSSGKMLDQRFRIVTRSSADSPHRSIASSGDRKSTRLNSSHGYISYAVFCLKKKKKASMMQCYSLSNLLDLDI